MGEPTPDDRPRDVRFVLGGMPRISAVLVAVALLVLAVGALATALVTG
jgi:hypothetical protein